MSEYVPGAGHLHYAKVRDRTRIFESTNPYGQPVIERVAVRDGSYSGWVFRCVATDSTMVVTQPVLGHWIGSEKPYVMRRDQFYFEPVGPHVARALNLEQ